MNIRDIKSGDYVAFVYKGNTAIAEIDDDNAHFKYAVGLWFSPDIIGKKDAVWLNDNLYHINNVFDIEKTLRHANAEEVKYFEQVVDQWERVHLGKEDDEEGREERPRLPGIKVVGKIDLDKIKGTSDSPYMLEKKKTERHKTFQIFGYYPAKGEVVKIQKKFKEAGKKEGVAIMKDASHFYVAIGFFPDRPTATIFDSDDEDGLLPTGTLMYRITEDMPIETLTANVIKEQYAEDIKKYDILEQERIKAQKEEEERKRLAEQKAKEETERAEQEKEENPSFEYTPADDPLIHVKYIRGEKKLMDMSYPKIDDKQSPAKRFYVMTAFARLIELMKKYHALTYKMSDEYFEELKSRIPHYSKVHNWKDYVTAVKSVGIINYPFKDGIFDNLFYCIGNREEPSITMFLMRGDDLLFYCSLKDKGDFVNMSRDCHRHSVISKRNIKADQMTAYCVKLIVAHLQMETDTSNIINEIVKYTGDKFERKELNYKGLNDDSVITYDDVVIRDSSWYTSIWEQRMIPVSGYLSHRWCGSGNNKVLTEVTVRPHVRNGYTKAAKVLHSS